MSNPPAISLVPGVAQAFKVVVIANNVLPDGSNPGQVDTTSTLVLEPIQGTGPSGSIVCIPSIDPIDNRRVICTPGVVQPGSTPIPWSFRVKANGRTAAVIASGTTSAPPDVSGTSWDGNPVVGV
jgi:hypothetical protein